MKKIIALLCIFFMITGCSTINNDVSNLEEKLMEVNMKLWINDQEIPVLWENNVTTNELNQDVSDKEIIIDMAKYSNNEQVGSLGKSYTSNDQYITTSSGDVVLYNNSQIVVFYGSNSWSYTKLGKMNLTSQEIDELLSKEDVTLKLTK